ncbi:ABC transporter ATP-binding protein [Hathewaya limosa]|uniref:ATP-binding cassette subfamily B protein n=1 Tax=Hathewaya limosa TaxID=1536 RepID=A0ABU0JWX2_HATLI|nr:ABC transporter ATP-binding protein [Hathewaya limosa]MDQ0480417.1 ATP-binding cassette subfamily B protein [Hathewaya limosa]
MKKLLKFLKPYSTPLIGVLLLLFFQSLSDLYLPNLMSKIVDSGVVKGDTNYILKIGAIMLGVAFFSAICTIIAGFISSKIATKFGRDLRKDMFSKVENFSLGEVDKIGTASLITRTTNDINQLQQVLTIFLRMMVTAPIMCIGGIIMAVSKNAKLSLILIVIIPLLMSILGLIGKKSIPLFKSMQVKLDKLNLIVRENLTGIRVIRAFNRINTEKTRFDESNSDLTNTAIKVNKLMALLMPIMMLILNLSAIAILWFGGIQIDNLSMNIGDLMAFIQYIMQILSSFLMFSMMFILLPRASASSERINEVLDLQFSIKNIDAPKTCENIKGYVEFKNVSFSYPGAESPALSNISFISKPGEITAIIGGTGSGKSTLASLIPRFYDITEGELLIDNVDIRKMHQNILRNKIGFVPQKAVLFSGSIKDNLRYGKEDATEEELKHAASIAQATEFISNMKDGFESYISQGGTNVSGGQKQRLAIARALVRQPEIYVFDDSFSALDFKTDAKLRAALKDETKNSTVIIIAQRVSSIIDADRIIVLDEGKIVGMGTHKELLKSCDIYNEIVSSQLSKEELENEQ